MGNKRQASKRQRKKTTKDDELIIADDASLNDLSDVEEQKGSRRKQKAATSRKRNAPSAASRKQDASSTAHDAIDVDADATLDDIADLLKDDDVLYEDLHDNGDESEKSEDEVFSIKYEVPYSNGIRTLTLSSATPFDQFLKALTTKMMGPAVSLGYIPSFAPKTPKPLPKLLEDNESYDGMMEDIESYIVTCRSKNRGKGVVKPFVIHIIDTSSGGDSKKTSLKAKANDPKPALPAETNDDQEHKLMQQIEKHHACSEHKGKACYVRNDGSHYQYTFSDLSIWVLLLRKRHATITHPPEKLNLSDKQGAQLAIQKRSATEAVQNHPMQWPMPLPYPYMQTPWPSQTSIQTTNSVGTSGSDKPQARAPSHSIKYPPISDWLASLDGHADRGKDDLNYSQYTDSLRENGIIRLDDILAIQAAEKLQTLGGMNWGTANRLLRFADEDRDDLLHGNN